MEIIEARAATRDDVLAAIAAAWCGTPVTSWWAARYDGPRRSAECLVCERRGIAAWDGEMVPASAVYALVDHRDRHREADWYDEAAEVVAERDEAALRGLF